jgi:hypothetical protein
MGLDAGDTGHVGPFPFLIGIAPQLYATLLKTLRVAAQARDSGGAALVRFVYRRKRQGTPQLEGKLLGNLRGIGSLGSVGVRQGIVKANTLNLAAWRGGGRSHPHSRFNYSVSWSVP